MSIRSKPIQAIPFKRGYHPHPSKGRYTEDENLAKRIALAVKRDENHFVHFDELYVRSGDNFVPWWKP